MKISMSRDEIVERIFTQYYYCLSVASSYDVKVEDGLREGISSSEISDLCSMRDEYFSRASELKVLLVSIGAF